MNKLKITAAIILLFVLAGCSSEVIGRVGDKELRQEDLDKRLAVFRLFSPGLDITAAERSDVLDQLLEEELLVMAADGKDISAAEDEVEEAMAEIKEELRGQFGDDKKLDKALKKFKISWDELTQIVARRSKIGQLYLAVTADVIVSKEEVAAYYEEHQAEFSVPEQVEASHILVEEPDLADDIRARLSAGADFAELAMEHSIDGSATDGGQLGYFGPGRMVAEFEQAAFDTPVGEISPVVQTQFGYHIIMVTDKRPAHISSLEEVQEFLALELENREKNMAFMSYLTELEKDVGVKNLLSASDED